MFESNEEFFHATNELVASLERRGHGSEARILKDGLASLNGLTDGWALLLDAVREVESRAKPVFTDSEKELIGSIHDTVYRAVYRRKRKPWWKFWQSGR